MPLFTAATAPTKCLSCGMDHVLIWATDFRSYKCDECGTFESMDD